MISPRKRQYAERIAGCEVRDGELDHLLDRSIVLLAGPSKAGVGSMNESKVAPERVGVVTTYSVLSVLVVVAALQYGHVKVEP